VVFCVNLRLAERIDMMGRLCLGLSLPLLLGAAAQQDLPEGWQTVTSKDGKFKVAMPGKVTEKKQQVKTGSGDLKVTLLIADGRKDSNFVVSFTDYPEADVKKGSVKKRLDQARDGAVSSAGGKVREEREIKLKKHPGRHVVIEKEDDVIARMRLFYVGQRLYQVMVLGDAPAKDVEAFLSSFELIE
jgi:hypothetical protein